MWPEKPSHQAAVIGAIAPQSATTVQVTGWLSAASFVYYLAKISTGVISASGTVDAKIQQAQDATGTGAKDIAGKAITQLTQASGGSNKVALINLKVDELDVTNGYQFIQLSVTPAVAAALIEADLFGFFPAYGPADTNPAAIQAQTIA